MRSETWLDDNVRLCSKRKPISPRQHSLDLVNAAATRRCRSLGEILNDNLTCQTPDSVAISLPCRTAVGPRIVPSVKVR